MLACFLAKFRFRNFNCERYQGREVSDGRVIEIVRKQDIIANKTRHHNCFEGLKSDSRGNRTSHHTCTVESLILPNLRHIR